MVMSVPVRRRKAKRVKCRKLPLYFPSEVRFEFPIKGITATRDCRIAREPAMGVREAGKSCRLPIAQREMEPHTEIRAAAGDSHCVLRFGFIHHQARLREGDRAGVLLDRLIYAVIATEVVARQEKVFQRFSQGVMVPVQ